MTTFLRRTISGLTLLSVGCFCARADVTMPAIFGDHMVLQQDTKLPVWGWAAPSEKVTVTFDGQSVSATADADGKWRADLAPVKAGTKPGTLTIAGKNTVTIQDVLVGDVWLASGQSNMEFGVTMLEKPEEVVAAANEPELRIFSVPRTTALTPLKDVKPAPADRPLMSKWQICSPDTLGKAGTWGGFSAVAYFFGREIQHTTKRPVGLVLTSWGGTPAQAWTSIEGLKKEPALDHYVQSHLGIVNNFDKASIDYPAKKAAYDAEKTKWDAEVGEPTKVAVAAWSKEVAALPQGTPPPAKPQWSKPPPVAPKSPDGGQGAPTALYNGMVAPLVPFAIKGAIWYQGEANAGTVVSAEEYSTLFPAMIKDWREKWAQGDFPFLYVQLASYTAAAKSPSEGVWPWLRESQSKTLAVSNTAMAVAVDVGNEKDIHPKDKLDVGLRLALAAKKIAYGEKVVDSGPVYDSMEVKGSKVVIHFKEINGGLKYAAAPWVPDGGTPVAPTELTGFAIAGEDKQWSWGKAVIEGDTVVVSSDTVTAPVAVRYGWANTPPVDLYNAAGLPASPFRTDTWEDGPVPQPPKPPAK